MKHSANGKYPGVCGSVQFRSAWSALLQLKQNTFLSDGVVSATLGQNLSMCPSSRQPV